MTHNRATIYSNGIADFQRVYSISAGQPQKISIPVRQQHLADVLASLSVFGDVRIDGPPSFRPANQHETNLVISTDNSLTDLISQLAGAQVEVTIASKVVSGKILGLQYHQTATTGEPISEQFLILSTETGLNRFALRQIENFFFVEESIRTEISKSLSRSLQEIKSNSTFVELMLSSNSRKTARAIIQYTIPAAAWKISYRLIQNKNSPIEFHGHAIVDNNTDEDWKDFVIAVVMGQPITFSTDLADSKTPQRGHVNVVQDAAIGSVEVEMAMDLMSVNEPTSTVFEQGRLMAGAPQKMMKRSMVAQSRGAAAEIETAEITETGDFCIFESAKPVSIDAHRSAIIPVFQTPLDESKPVLHFKLTNHGERPFRAIQFKNTTPHSLGRGVCTVYDQQTYVGNCLLPTTQPGGTALLPHALETAVRIRCEAGKIESRRIGIRLSGGIAYESYHKLLRTEYVINSQRHEAFQFVLDHDLRLENCQVLCQLIRKSADPVELKQESLKIGRRIEFELLPTDVVKVVFVETGVARSQVQLTGNAATDEKFRVVWLYDNLIDANLSLAHDPAVKRCTDLQRELDEKNNQINHARDELQRLIARQQRLRENIKVGAGDHQTARYQDDLARTEDNLVQLEEEHLPELVAERDDRRRELFKALKSLALEWSE